MQSRTLTVSSVGQITIPRSVRELLGFKPGVKLNLEINQEKNTITLKRQKTHEEIFAELEAFHKTLPKSDPKLRHMSVGEMSLELAEDIEGETWV